MLSMHSLGQKLEDVVFLSCSYALLLHMLEVFNELFQQINDDDDDDDDDDEKWFWNTAQACAG